MNKTTDIQPMPGGDLILREVWHAKDALFAECGRDLDRLFEETRKRERLSGHPLVKGPKRRKEKD